MAEGDPTARLIFSGSEELWIDDPLTEALAKLREGGLAAFKTTQGRAIVKAAQVAYLLETQS